MSATKIPRILCLPLLPLLCAGAQGDEIHLVDGTSVKDCSIERETFKEVEYREAGKKKTVPTEQVLRIEYSAMPTLVDRAENAVRDEQVFDAIGDLETYVEGFLAGGKRERHQWAPAYAAFRLVQLQRMVSEPAKAIAAANLVIEKFPESRFLPAAYLARAQAQFDLGDAAKAQQTLKDFQAVVQTQSLPQRWQLEGQLAKVLLDPNLQGQARRDALAELTSKAGRAHPTVRNAAEVAEAESFLEAKDFARAEKIFQRIVDDPKAGRATLAAAYTGLGDCLFQRAATMEKESPEARQLLKSALLHFMRVVVVHGDQTRYVPKAMFYAARIFDMSEEDQAKDNAQKLYRSIIRTYDATSWATEAKGFRRR